MRALLHAHSDYSYDGESTLEELADWGSSKELDLVLLTEHVNDFDHSKMKRYLRDLDALDNDRCRLVPGLEFAIRGGFHVLGFNLRSWDRIVEPLEAVRFIRDQGGLAVLAHPGRYNGRWPDREVLGVLHGIEVWNARYDGRFVPSGAILDATRVVCSGFEHLNLYGGQDLHEITNNRLVTTDVDGEAGVEAFFQALERGRATFGARGFRFGSRPDGPAPWPGLLRVGHRSYRLAKLLRDRWTE